jgi:dUTP pyrophosphatase
MTIFVKRLREGVAIPQRMSSGAAGFDLAACLTEDLYMEHHKTYKIPTGIALQMPSSMMALIVARSGAAVDGITIEHPPIDSDYRGEIHLIARWHGDTSMRPSFRVKHGDRIAQLLFFVSLPMQLVETDRLSETARGDGGFGSTDA